MGGVAVVTHAWFPAHQALLEALRETLAVPLVYFVLSETDPNREWRLPRESPIGPRVIPGRRITLGPHHIVLNLRVRKYLQAVNPAVVVTEGWGDPGYLAAHRYAMSTGTPIVTWMCGRDPRAGEAILGRLARGLSNVAARRAVRASRRVFVYGTHARGDALALGARPEDVVIVRQSIEEDHFDRRNWKLSAAARIACRRDLGLDDQPLFLCVAQLVPRKGITDLLSAFRELQRRRIEAQVLLIGRGELAGMVEEFAAAAGARFVWRPSVPYEDMPRYYAISDCFVFPTHFDAWGNVVNESHCAQLPVICSSAAQAAADLIPHGESGLVYPSGDVRALTECMAYAVRHPREMAAMAMAGYRFVQDEWNSRQAAKIWKSGLEHFLTSSQRPAVVV
jgi:glycosyltransferase involved in cell wall biosynthesis